MDKNGSETNIAQEDEPDILYGLFLEFRLNDGDKRPCVIAAGQTHFVLASLIEAHPELCEEERLSYCCGLVMHFHPGPGCIMIEDADEFRTRYGELLQITLPQSLVMESMIQIPPPTIKPEPVAKIPPPLSPAVLKVAASPENTALLIQPVPDDTTPADFGPFDLSEIVPPYIEQDKLIFYAEQLRYSIPYKVEVPWPPKAEGDVRFTLLSLRHD